MTEESWSKLTETALSAVLVVAVYSGFVGFIGRAHYLAYLREWKLSEGLFPAPSGYFAFLGNTFILIFSGYLILALAIGLLLTLILFFIGEISFLRRWIHKFIAWLSERISKPEENSLQSEEKIERIAWWGANAIHVLFVVLILIWTMSVSEKLGRDKATDQMSAFSNREISKRTLKMSAGGEMKGYVVTCSASHCAMLSSDTLRVVSTSEIEQIAWAR